MNVQSLLDCYCYNQRECYLNCRLQSWGSSTETHTLWAGLAIACFPLGCATLTVLVRKGQLLATRIFKKNDDIAINPPLSLKQEEEEENLPEVGVQDNQKQDVGLNTEKFYYAFSLVMTGSSVALTGLFHAALRRQMVENNCIELCEGMG